MRYLLSAVLIAGASLLHAETIERPVPAPALLKRINAGFERYGIVHFSINTFTDREWGYGNERPEWFNPSAFDADQIVRACKDGGLQGLVVVAKHHDGFCLWRTKTTEHSIAKSSFRGGKGDYVKEMQLACERHGLAFGVYVSPWDRNNAVYGTPEYREIFRQQVLELFSGAYGRPFELWFDGANGGDGYYGGAREKRKIGTNYYRFQELIDEVRAINPDVCVFYDFDEGELHYPGTEGGDLHPDARASFPTRAQQPSNERAALRKMLFEGDIDGRLFKQAECDVPMRKGWFYHATHDGYDRSPEFLMKIYLRTCGNGGTMNLGISPDRRGLLTDEDVRILKEFNGIRQTFFEKNVTPEVGFNVVVMREDVANGERVDGWELLLDGRTLASGMSIGIKRIRVLDRIEKGAKLELRVTKACGKPGAVTTELFAVDPALVAKVLAAEPPPPPKSASDVAGKPTARTSASIVYDCGKSSSFASVRIGPDLDDLEGMPVNFRLAFSDDGKSWRTDPAEHRLDNIAANPIPQVVELGRTETARYVRLESVRTLKEGTPLARVKLTLVTVPAQETYEPIAVVNGETVPSTEHIKALPAELRTTKAEAEEINRRFAAERAAAGYVYRKPKIWGHGHSFSQWPKGDVWENHREFFGLTPYGTRGVVMGEGFPSWIKGLSKVCVANEDVIDWRVAEWEKAGLPEYVSISENDGVAGYCRCEKCRALDADLPGERFLVNKTDRYVNFWNRMLTKMRAKRPDVKGHLYIYSVLRHPPRREKIACPENFLGSYVPSYHDSLEQVEAELKAWKEAGLRHFFLRPNYLHNRTMLPFGREKFICDVHHLFRRYGSLGDAFDSCTTTAATKFEIYTALRLCARPELTFEEISAEWYATFGAASDCVKRYYEHVRARCDREFPKVVKRLADKGIEYLDDSHFSRNIHKLHTVAELEEDLAILESFDETGLEGAARQKFEDLRLCARHYVMTLETLQSKSAADKAKLVAFRAQHKNLLSQNWWTTWNKGEFWLWNDAKEKIDIEDAAITTWMDDWEQAYAMRAPRAEALSGHMVVRFPEKKGLRVPSRAAFEKLDLALAGADGVWHRASLVNTNATCELMGNHLVLRTAEVPKPLRVRYRTGTEGLTDETGKPIADFWLEAMPFYGPTIRDRIWMWGHHADMSRSAATCGKPKGSKAKWPGKSVEQAEGCRLMGIPNDCVIRWGNKPAYPWGDYFEQFKDMKRISFGIIDGGRQPTEEKMRIAFEELRPSMPNLTGCFLDDYFLSKNPKFVPNLKKLENICSAVHAHGLRVSVVAYADQVGLRPDFKPHFDLVDEVSFWFWKGASILTMEENVRACRQMIGPDKDLLLGLYMWDFDKSEPQPADLMKMQLDCAHRLLKEKVINGLLFHPSFAAALDVPAVNLSKAWIAEHGDEAY